MGNEKTRPIAHVCTASALAATEHQQISEEKLFLLVLLWTHRSLLPAATQSQGAESAWGTLSRIPGPDPRQGEERRGEEREEGRGEERRGEERIEERRGEERRGEERETRRGEEREEGRGEERMERRGGKRGEERRGEERRGRRGEERMRGEGEGERRRGEGEGEERRGEERRGEERRGEGNNKCPNVFEHLQRRIAAVSMGSIRKLLTALMKNNETREATQPDVTPASPAAENTGTRRGCDNPPAKTAFGLHKQSCASLFGPAIGAVHLNPSRRAAEQCKDGLLCSQAEDTRREATRVVQSVPAELSGSRLRSVGGVCTTSIRGNR
ncbi:hypothetical protein D4764_05G0000770 [Takifugu flavidus]|uniref:Uncharacterized protein n=1 Tax=Takifugu flavidus TaxID=433684 RepID=A0A5C6N2R2_9TELE|nr:hypothetical protein D4764_05G0000770 [Takifugu flavidus]